MRILNLNLFIGVALSMSLIASRGEAVAEAREVFAVSPVYSLRTDGTCQELTGGAFGSLAQNNGNWDAATKTIKLTAARNEEVAVQLIIPKAGKALAGRMSDLSGPGSIAADRATFSAPAVDQGCQREAPTGSGHPTGWHREGHPHVGRTGGHRGFAEGRQRAGGHAPGNLGSQGCAGGAVSGRSGHSCRRSRDRRAEARTDGRRSDAAGHANIRVRSARIRHAGRRPWHPGRAERRRLGQAGPKSFRRVQGGQLPGLQTRRRQPLLHQRLALFQPARLASVRASDRGQGSGCSRHELGGM